MTSTLLFPSESLTIDEAAELAAEGALLSRIGVDDVRRVVPYLERARARPHAVLAQEGSEDRGVFMILSGTARLCRSGVDLGSIGKGSHFGTLGRWMSPRARASVIAESPIELAWLRPERYEQLCHDDPMLALRVAESLAEAIQGELTVMTDNVGLLLRERTLPRHVFVDVTVGNAWQRVRTGTPLASLLPAEIGGDRVVAALVNNKAVALAMPVLSDAHIEPLLASHWEGKRVYRSSLGLLLLEAARRVDPRATVRLGPSIGFGQPVEVMGANGLPVTTWVERVEGMMRELVATNFALRQELWTVDEARSHFAEHGARDLVALLRTWRAGHVQLVRAGESVALYMGPLLPHAGHIEHAPFRLVVDRDGICLRYGDEAQVEAEGGSAPSSNRSAEYLRPAGLHLGVRTDEPWLTTLGITSVGAFNDACVRGKTPEIIRVSEGLHEKRIGRIADAICDNGKIRAICVAGPSSSGKTTFIKRLDVQLLVSGLRPVGLSLDDYYVDREKTRRDTNGDYDFEALEALDLDMLDRDLRRIFAGETVKTARYDFVTGKSIPGGGPEVALRGSDVLVIEGIHGLNPRLLDSILERERIFRVFIQPMTALPFDNMNRINVSDMRLLRRIVRDRHTRGYNAASNILRWPSVRAGEKNHIFPFLAQADAIFDSSLVYELSVIKVFADRYLLEVPQEHPSFATAYRLRQLIDKFVTIYPDHVPPTSILREFIGESGFEY
ncbi:MAG: cyclic nucleotide-binding domain-containing protein [Polyangiaceae bacterium]|nr:cyclic nucleotide-binding domain-containing protein [Polyangiaceae bacterium]